MFVSVHLVPADCAKHNLEFRVQTFGQLDKKRKTNSSPIQRTCYKLELHEASAVQKR
jgi:hypothetical protein